MGGLNLEPENVAFLDIGTNSIRLLVVRIDQDGTHRVLSAQKEVVRLGDGEFGLQRLLPDAIDRGVRVCTRFVEMARSFHVEMIIAVATSAVREAKNQADFVDKVLAETGVQIQVVSGVEEARLIYLGVAAGLHFPNQTALFIDIGGGSTELVVGTQQQSVYLDSLRLGAIRVTGEFLTDHTGPVPYDLYQSIRRHVLAHSIRAIQRVRAHGFDFAVGSSGTIENLQEMCSRTRETHDGHLHITDLRSLSEVLCSMTLEERRNAPGINSHRADIIIGGMAVIHTLMEELNLSKIAVSNRGLRDGLLVDYISRTSKASSNISIRERSVIALGRKCGYDEDHAMHVAHLADGLFDSARQQGLHGLGEWEREMLRYAAILHDVGAFITYQNHHRHSGYIIKSSNLLGFNQAECDFIAGTAALHRKGAGNTDRVLETLQIEGDRESIRILGLLLRLAESLDRTHSRAVQGAGLRKGQREVVLELHCSNGADLEKWGAASHDKLVRRLLKKPLKVTGFREDR